MTDARAMGASESALARLRASIEAAKGLSKQVLVWPEHWHALKVFLAMDTQWRTHLGVRGLFYEGLDYAALPPVLAEHRRLPRRLRQPMDRLMPQLRTLELEARTHLNQA